MRSPGAGRAGMVAAGIFRPDLDATLSWGQIPPSRVPEAEPATRTAPHYLRFVVISRVRHGYRAPEPRGRERKKYSAPVWLDRKSRPAQVLPEALPGRLGTWSTFDWKDRARKLSVFPLPTMEAFQRM